MQSNSISHTACDSSHSSFVRKYFCIPIPSHNNESDFIANVAFLCHTYTQTPIHSYTYEHRCFPIILLPFFQDFLVPGLQNPMDTVDEGTYDLCYDRLKLQWL